jgi:ubiquinone/menaquinone biosynthesis C-methylase UbiE
LSQLPLLILIGFILAAIGALVWWLVIPTEGVYLGRRMVVWLYDLYAHRYDAVKNYYRQYEHMYLAQPIMDAIAPNTMPLVLDVATGTGRLPLALNRHTHFDGFVIGVDLSRKMLHYASQNIYPYDHRVAFIWAPAETLPFDDNTFDVVTCLEALEFMTSPPTVLKELVRVLRPGGLLLVTQRINTKLMPGKIWSSEQIQSLLETYGVDDGKAQIWQVDYRKVWGRKRGESAPIGVKPLGDLLRCPRCCQKCLQSQEGAYICENCGARVPVESDGVIELAPLLP